MSHLFQIFLLLPESVTLLIGQVTGFWMVYLYTMSS